MGTYGIKGRLIDGIADLPLENGLVVVDGDSITYAGPYDAGKVTGGMELFDAGNGTVLPGFIDCHAHLCGEHTAGSGARSDDMLLAAAHELGILLDAGFTGLRDMSVNGFALARAVEYGYLRGPHIMPGGRVLSVTSGHVDVELGSEKEEYNRKNRLGRLCDGVDDCLLAAREQFRHGARFFKVCATGGVSSIADGVDDVQFSFDELRAIVEEAERHGTYVAAHCTGDAGARQAIAAGVTCIEHGVMLEEDTVRLMAEKDLTLVTTLSVSLGVAGIPGLHPSVAKKAKLCAEANIRTIEMARAYGVRIALGTDYSNSPNSPYARNGKEFEAMVRAGMTPMEAVKAGTVNAAYLLRRPEVGTLTAGRRADIVLVDGNPVEDIAVLGDSDRIRLVIQNGVVHKNRL